MGGLTGAVEEGCFGTASAPGARTGVLVPLRSGNGQTRAPLPEEGRGAETLATDIGVQETAARVTSVERSVTRREFRRS